MLSHFWDHCSAFVDLRHSSLQNQGPGIRDQATAICWKVRLSPLNRSELQKQGIAASICNFVICTFLALFPYGCCLYNPFFRHLSLLESSQHSCFFGEAGCLLQMKWAPKGARQWFVIHRQLFSLFYGLGHFLVQTPFPGFSVSSQLNVGDARRLPSDWTELRKLWSRIRSRPTGIRTPFTAFPHLPLRKKSCKIFF